ncbi:MAG: hypothetical protein K0R82_2419, partial [Flavipsychrobacter sp.]|nr:hypothetical protein [Flavipsychrobacter sp.]
MTTLYRLSLLFRGLLPALYLFTAFQLKAQPPVC